MAQIQNADLQVLSIHTPDGLNQCVHPDVVCTNDGRYFLAVTPYPFGAADYENPVIYRSSDLENWSYVAGPIDHQQPGARNHLSDPTLVWPDGQKMSCFYRECLYDRDIPVTNIYRMTSCDGIEWGEKTCVCSHPMAELDVISPSVRWDEKRGLHGYFCLSKGKKMALMYTADGSFQPESVREIPMDLWMPSGKILWHVSHICDGERDFLLLTLSDGFGGANSELYVGMFHNETGVMQRITKVSLKNRCPVISLEYRACGILNGDSMEIIASVQLNNRMWGCVKLRMDLAELTA